MRAAIVMAEVLDDNPEGLAELRRLHDAGVAPVVLSTGDKPTSETFDAGEFPAVACGFSSPECWAEGLDLLNQAAAKANAAAHETFLICGDTATAGQGVAAGCRPMLVLGRRTLRDVMGDEEPGAKHVPVAQDLATVVTYAIDEKRQDDAVGPFPFGPTPSLERSVRPLGPSPRDMAVIFAVVIFAGVTMALGIAYLLQEAYQTVRFPPIAYWVTLQFIPQTWRGVLFMGVGVALGLVAGRILSRMARRRRTGV